MEKIGEPPVSWTKPPILEYKAIKLLSFKQEIHMNIYFHSTKASANYNVPCHYH